MLKVPCKITLTGDKDYARNFMGAGQSQMRILENQMSFQDLKQGARRVRLNSRVTVEALACFNLREVVIHCLPIKRKEKEGIELLPKHYVYVTISNYVTVWDLLTGEVAKDVCDNDGNLSITFPCHKSKLVKWLEGIKDKPTRQILKDGSKNNRDFIEDNELDIGNENRTSEEEEKDVDHGLFLDNDMCSGCVRDSQNNYYVYPPWTNFVRGDIQEGRRSHSYCEASKHEDCVSNKQGIPRGDCDDSWCSHHKMHTTLGGRPSGNDVIAPRPDWDGSFVGEQVKRCKHWNKSDDEFGLTNNMQFLESYRGIDLDARPCLPSAVLDALSDDPLFPNYKDTAHTKGLGLVPFGHSVAIDKLKMNRSLFCLKDSMRLMPNEECLCISTWEWHQNQCWVCHNCFSSVIDYKSYRAEGGYYFFYSYDTPVGQLMLDHVPARKLKYKYGTLDNYVTCQELMRDFNIENDPVQVSEAYLEALHRLDLGELSFYVENACPQYTSIIEDKGGIYCVNDTADFTHKYNLSGHKTRQDGVIGESNRYAVSWCANKEISHGTKYKIQIFFKMGQYYYSEEMLDHITGEESVITKEKRGDRYSSAQAIIELKNYKNYAKKNLTIEDEEITVERPRKYERIETKDFSGARIYNENNDERIYPFDGTYDIYTLGEAVEELINNHYEDGSNDQLLVYLYERPDMIEKEEK